AAHRRGRARSSSARGARAASGSGAGTGRTRDAVRRLGPVSVLQQVHWRRIILDEAHAIKNRRCATARAAMNLTADRRWCLSGTPLQNRVGEMFSLLRFLRAEPYVNYYCKNCPCKTLDYSYVRHVPAPGAAPLLCLLGRAPNSRCGDDDCVLAC
ncbi:MAG: hypothetical protein EOO41_01755, partial [Methanobacteriota archaeon]